MKNYEINRFRSEQIFDMHIHTHVEMPLADAAGILRDVMRHMNYSRIVLESLPSHDKINNFRNLYFKSVIRGAYAGLGLVHRGGEADTEEGYRKQAETLWRMGCDGYKMLEGKPEYRKKLGRPLCDGIFDGFYGFAEEKGLPVVLHFGDPREFWDREKIPDWALKRGWLYDGSFVPFREEQKEVEGILEKFPSLHLILAHFFFVSDDIGYASEFLNRWKNVSFDLTPGSEMYLNFEEKPEEWREFFLRNRERLLFGTDIYNWPRNGRTEEETYAHAVNLVRAFLERREPFRSEWLSRVFERPFGLPDEVLDKIYRQNFLRVFGETPRRLDPALIARECEAFSGREALSEEEKRDLRTIALHFEKGGETA